MSGAPGIPQTLAVQAANQEILVSWALTAGATSYIVNRSQDNVTYTTVATVSGSPLATSYLDTAVTLGTQYWYTVAASNTSGTSPVTNPQSAVPTPTGEMCLSQIRLQAMQRADRVNSNFLTLAEWNTNINKAMFELYDLLVTVYEDYFIASPIGFPADGVTYLYPLPNGSNTFQDTNNNNAIITPPPFYKLMGVDLALNNATNAYVTINKFNFIDRNRFVYPNTASTIYGVFNLQYRVMGSNIEFIPTPSAGQQIRLWYIPRLTELLQDTDTTTMGVSGWIEYVIVRAAKYALDKEESDSTRLTEELLFLKQRIEESAANRDAGQPDKISSTRNNNGSGWGNGFGGGWNGGTAGWAILFLPIGLSNNGTHGLLTNSKFFAQGNLGYTFAMVAIAYICNLLLGKFGSTISFPKMSSFFSRSLPAFGNHVSNIVDLSAEKQMVRVDALPIITSMTNLQFSYRSPEKLIRDSSNSKPLSADGKSRSLIVSPSATIPEPTSISFNYFVHKSINVLSHIKNYIIKRGDVNRG